MIERYIEALTPSAATKAAYIGEFQFTEEVYNPELDLWLPETYTVPWTTIKEIMAFIKERAEDAD